jgi:hypothetical protein
MPLLRRHALTASPVSVALILTFGSVASGCGETPQPLQLKDHECGPQGARCPDEQSSSGDQDGTYPCGPQGAVCRLPKPKQ